MEGLEEELETVRTDDVERLFTFDESHHARLLSSAVHFNAIECVKHLLFINPSLATVQRYGSLHRAATFPFYEIDAAKRLRVLKLFIAAGADVNTEVTMSRSVRQPLLTFVAGQYDRDNVNSPWYEECGHLLLEAGANAQCLRNGHPFRKYWDVIQRAKSARAALFKVMCMLGAPKDLARLVATNSKIMEWAQTWM